MNRKQLKNHIARLLSVGPPDILRNELQGFKARSLVNPLISLLCHTEDRIRWNAVFMLGWVIDTISESDIENGRVIMRRLLWMLNDESGGIGWGVPEAMAETMFHNRTLAREYLHMLVSYTKDDGPELFQDGNFLELPMMQQGVLWGVCRVAEKYPSALLENGITENLSVYFASANNTVRGLVCRLCGLLQADSFRSNIQSLIPDEGMVQIYSDTGGQQYSVGSLAKQALLHLDRGSISQSTPGGRSWYCSPPRQ